MNNKRQEIIVNKHMFIIRAAENSDYDFIFALLKENMLAAFEKHWGSWNEKSFGENYHKEHMRVIEHNNERIGYIDFKFKNDCGYLNNIQLSTKIRDKGLGTYIMRMLEQETLNRGQKRICLKVFKDNRAIKLYERLGYIPISEEPTSLIMEKQL
jgi:ribosomal protein S18 acetylase RimI-like enzyme